MRINRGSLNGNLPKNSLGVGHRKEMTSLQFPLLYEQLPMQYKLCFGLELKQIQSAFQVSS